MSSTSCNKSFCSHYMLLNPNVAELCDVVKILFSSDIGKRKFIDYFGNGVEHWLNLLSRDGGFLGLINNTFKGKVVQPDKTSESFTSFIGNLDKRFELDPVIGFEDKRYYAALSVMASKASYENNNFIQALVDDCWNMNLVNSYDFWNDYQEKATTQAFIMDDKRETIVVAFKGTGPFNADAWSSDIDLSWYEIPGIGKMHGGFMKALGLLKTKAGRTNKTPNSLKPTAYYAIRKHLKKLMQQNEKAKFIGVLEDEMITFNQ
ncbi:hypothetical protein SASPL_135665 [Salvia splendens]|uniref:Uncharacterized protein n=1 Tax=Salvia splendens TaxID=180675 RepID=A0A8X8X0K8_SALSN|nr:hypothetical protein SASPL_135665 [Salvia splendens]